MSKRDLGILLRVAGTYALISITYILLSDTVLGALVRDAEQLTALQSAKGLIFVLVTTALLAALLAAELRRRQRIERRLRGARGSFAAAFGSTSAYMALIRRRDHAVVNINPAFAEAMGAPPEALTGRALEASGARAVAPGGTELWAQLDRDGAAAAWAVSMQSGDGRQLELSMDVDAVTEDDEDCWLIVATDVTQLRRSEAEVRALERKFQHAQKMEALGTLAGGVAHDFNNLLGVIMSFADFAQDTLPQEHAARGDIAEIINAGKRASRLTHQLLAFCRQQTTEPSVLRVHEALEGLKRLLGRVIGEDIELHISAPAELPPLVMDPSLFDQVLMNLAVNARDAMPTGGRLRIEADLGTTPSRPAGSGVEGPDPVARWIHLKVSDDGVGMDAATRERAFEPFFSTKGDAGTGLGLSLVYGAVTQAGGTVTVDSETGRGTTFHIAFPVAPPEAIEAVMARSASSRDLRGSEPILVVEDEPAVRELVSRILRRHGYDVVTVPDAHEALRLVEEERRRVALVVSDVVLPRMSGIELGRRLRELCPGIPVLFMTGYVDDTAVRHGLSPERREMHLIHKPFSATDFVVRVRSLLDGFATGAPSTFG